MDAGHRVLAREDPFLASTALTPVPAVHVVERARAVARAHARRPRRPARTASSELARLQRTGAITDAAYRSYSANLHTAIATVRRLRGTRAEELNAVLTNLHEIAVRRLLTPGRLPALFETLTRNRQWWSSGPLLSPGQRVEFQGSQLVWQYYPGQGLELQVLGSFGKADSLYTAGPAEYPQLESLLAELIPLAVQRGGGLTWEYYFHFDGGSPPWTSAMSQGTALEALTRAFKASGDHTYLDLAAQALPIFTAPPPVGVAVKTAVGTQYLQYSFAPHTAIINAFLQSLIGLYDYATVSGNAQAAQLFSAGDAEAQAELPSYDTGAWSLYEPGREDDLGYHNLVTGFLQQLCSRTQAWIYCTTAQHFQQYLKTPPVLQLLSTGARKRKPSRISFSVSKFSHVGIVVLRGTRTVFLTSAYFGYGTNSFAIPPLRHAGTYTVRLAATDPAGNFSRISGSVEVK
jgi:hypothetical protein